MQKIHQETYRRRELDPDDMSCCMDPAQFSFRTTDELPGIQDKIIGQPRAVSALDFGLKIRAPGYNLFVSGPVGTGKTTYTMRVLKKSAEAQPLPDDWCYVNNFLSTDEPLVLRLPAGGGIRFREAVNRLVAEAEQTLMRQFDSEEYAQASAQLLKSFNESAEKLWRTLQQEAQRHGMILQRTSTGFITLPLDSEGKPISSDALANMDPDYAAEVQDRRKPLEQLFDATQRQIKGLQKEAHTAQQVLDERTAAFAIGHLFEDLSDEFPFDKVKQYLALMQQDMVQNHSYFHHDLDVDQPASRTAGSIRDVKHRYQVNVLVSHQAQTGAPVVLETNPTYFNLFGKIEYRGTQGGLTSHFTLIKPGAVHQANGGYLLLQMQDLLSHPASWEGLKRTLMRSQIRIDNPAEETLWMSQSGLRPEPVPLDVKVILLGTPELYHLLQTHDDAFHKLFKVKAEFDSQMERTPESALMYANFVASYAQNNQLLPFSAEAVAKIIDFSSRQAGNQHKLSTRFNPVIEVLTEANYHAVQEQDHIVDAHHIESAILQKRKRSDLVREKVLEYLSDGTIKIDTSGTKVGQINGLSVLNTGDFLFGQPHRITARTFIGKRGVVNVERESAMSGHIHDKGLLILSGYLAGEFAQKHPLSISATLVFEQTYSMIDGDSASSTELYAILSALANVPIKQGIAVTGSVDQFGDVQPIGGVNDKIEGFFYVCQAQGLTGEQGVMIPYQNVANLFLSNEVAAAVRQGEFHIWPVKNVSEGIELLTGYTAGVPPYSEETIYGTIQHRLIEYAKSYGE